MLTIIIVPVSNFRLRRQILSKTSWYFILLQNIKSVYIEVECNSISIDVKTLQESRLKSRPQTREFPTPKVIYFSSANVLWNLVSINSQRKFDGIVFSKSYKITKYISIYFKYVYIAQLHLLAFEHPDTHINRHT